MCMYKCEKRVTVYVCECVLETDGQSERALVCILKAGGLFSQKHKELLSMNSPGGLLGNPSAHRERAEERLTYRKQFEGV